MHTGALTLYKSSSEHSIAEDHKISVKRTRISELLPRLRKAIYLNTKRRTEHLASPL